MNLEELMQSIALPKALQESVNAVILHMEEAKLPLIIDLTKPDLWQSARNTLQAQSKHDPNGMQMLSYMLLAVTKTYDMYQERGIDHQIFIDTMKCFTRFVHEHYISKGFYGFDRDFWTGRQCSMQLFRLGMLEYELSVDHSHISIHIPSDSALTSETCLASIHQAKCFFSTLDTRMEEVPYCCTEG